MTFANSAGERARRPNVPTTSSLGGDRCAVLTDPASLAVASQISRIACRVHGTRYRADPYGGGEDELAAILGPNAAGFTAYLCLGNALFRYRIVIKRFSPTFLGLGTAPVVTVRSGDTGT